MSAKIYGYAENSDDVEALQAYAGVDIILEDRRERGQYQMLRRFLREGDTLFVVRLSALGKSDVSISEELDYLLQRQVRLRVLELPVTLQELDAASEAVVYQALKEVLQVWKQRQAELQEQWSSRQRAGIQAARKTGRKLGRPTIGYPKGWKRIFGKWQAHEISVLEASDKLKISRSTFYRMVKRYQQGEKGGEVCLS